MKLVNAYTARGGSQRQGPLLHASPYPPRPYSKTGATYLAVCGAQVRNITMRPWNPHGPGRHCPACTKANPAPSQGGTPDETAAAPIPGGSPTAHR